MERQVRIRIGIHVGDVVVRAGDIHGDGVNIAARIEPLAVAGGICVSEDVARAVRNKLPFPLAPVRPRELKHIDLPVGVYRVVLPWEVASPTSAPRTVFSEKAWWATGTLLVGVVGTLLWLGARPTLTSRPEPAPPAASVPEKQSPPTSTETPPIDDKSVAVLPLENLSPDPENAFFTDGIHSEIIATLSRLPDLKVISRNSMLSFKGGMPLAEIGRKLGVATIVTGNVRRTGKQVRVQLELRRASDEAMLWSQTYDREIKDVFSFQSEMAMSVANVFQMRGAKGTAAAAEMLTKNPRALELHLKANSLWWTGQVNPAAISAWEEAVRLDPTFLSAVERLSSAHSVAYEQTTDPKERAWHKVEAKRWGDSASRLVAGGAGDSALGNYYLRVERDLPRALTYSQAAARVLPNDSAVLNTLANILYGLGRMDEALPIRRRAVELDPLNATFLSNLITESSYARDPTTTAAAIARAAALPDDSETRTRIAFAVFRITGDVPGNIAGLSPEVQATWRWRARRFEEGAAEVTRVLADPKLDIRDRNALLCWQADMLRRLGRNDEAQAAAQGALDIAERIAAVPGGNPDLNEFYRGRALARLGRGDDAVAAMKRFVALTAEPERARRWNREVGLAEVYALLGRERDAIDLLRRLLLVPSGLTVPMLRVDPTWDKLRENAEFQALLADPRNSTPL
jgi:TolB-like protein/tetratricopeptide (TPR) repeat protein